MPILPEDLKRGITPTDFYQAELPSMRPPRRIGWNDAGLCPFHADTHAGSFRVHTESGAFRCFACDAQGSDILAFVMLRDGLDFRETLDVLATEWGIRV
jgi:DNA primase